MGTIFSKFDKETVIIRGFPKIRYTHDSRVKDKECVAEEKVDGTNLGIWILPDNSVMGKTRMVQRWDLGSKRQKGTWKGKFEQVPNYEKVFDLAREGYLVFIELYGYHNAGEFVKYTVPMAIKVIGIVNMKNFIFLPRPAVEMLCNNHQLPLPTTYYKGTLTLEEVAKIEVNLEKEMALDGMEGLVAKYWDEKDRDSYFCKLKCEKVKEECYKLSRSLIPATIIRKCIKKAMDENLGERRIEVLYPIVLEELKEDFDNSLLEPSQGKIKGLIRYATTPSDADLLKRVKETMIEINNLGIDVTDHKNKGKVLSSLHNRLGDIRGGTLFKLYIEVLLQMKGKW